MNLFKRVFMMVAISLLTIGVASAQNSFSTYTDPDGRFNLPLPADWTDVSAGAIGHFVSPAGDIDLYLLAVEAADKASGTAAALAQVLPDFVGTPVQSSDIPLPGGIIWSQEVVVVEATTLLITLATHQAGTTYILIVQGEQAGIAAAGPTFNAALLGYAIGEGASAFEQVPAYVDPATYTEEAITLTSGTLALPAVLTLPVNSASESVPAVVLVHGSGPSDRDETIGVNKVFRDLALGLATQGIASLRYDKRTYVYQNDLAVLSGLDIDGEVTEDALAAIARLQATDGIDPARVFVIGHSLGGMMAPRIAEQSGTVAGVVVMAGNARPFGVVVAEQLAYLESLGVDPVSSGLVGIPEKMAAIREGGDAAVLFADTPLLARYFESLALVEQVATAQALTVPFLFLQGERDYQVTMEDFGLWQAAFENSDRATFISYPDLMHLMMALGDVSRKGTPSDYNEAGFVAQQVVDDIAAWINAQ